MGVRFVETLVRGVSPEPPHLPKVHVYLKPSGAWAAWVLVILGPASVWLILGKEVGKPAALSRLIKHSIFRGERKTHRQRRRVRNGRACSSMALLGLTFPMISTGHQAS